MSTSMAAARPTRRALVHGVAWSVPIVATTAAAPAFASSTARSSLSGIAGTAEKWGQGQDKHVSWDLTLTNGPVAIDEISITFTYTPKSAGPFKVLEIYGYSTAATRDVGWLSPTIPVAGVYTITATHSAEIPANSTYYLHTDFAGGDNAAGTVEATASIKYVGSATIVPLSIPPLEWGPGNQHVHPA